MPMVAGRSRRPLTAVVIAVAGLAVALAPPPAAAQASRSFEITGTLGRDAAAIGSGRSSGHPLYGVAVTYHHTAHPASARGLVASGTLAYAHTTSDGDALTAGKVGVDAYLMPAAAIGWRRERLRLGLAADYRLDVAFIDATPRQLLAGSYPGYLTGFFVGPFVSMALGPARSIAGRFKVEATFQFGVGTRIGATGPDGASRTVDLHAPHDLRLRLACATTEHLVLGVAYQRTDYPVSVAFEEGSVPRPFDQRHRGLVMTVGLVSH